MKNENDPRERPVDGKKERPRGIQRVNLAKNGWVGGAGVLRVEKENRAKKGEADAHSSQECKSSLSSDEWRGESGRADAGGGALTSTTK